MKILFVSMLTGGGTHGPSWSVPARIKHQELIDDVLWVNCTDAFMPHWGEVRCYHCLNEFGGSLALSVLPLPFQNPDIVVFEDFYYWDFWLFHLELRKKRIPYVVVPRGSLTMMAQNNSKKFKKRVANRLLFSSFIRNALCVHYLTEEEHRDSTDKWNPKCIVVPNGITLPAISKSIFSTQGIKAVFIGRLNAYHKGLDILLEACSLIKSDLKEAHFSLAVYGEKNRDYESLKNMVEDSGLTEIVSFPGAVYGGEKETVLLNADLFVITSRFEGLPMGLLEALAYGVPALVSPGTNMAKAVLEANAGWNTEENAEDISRTILKVIDEKGKLRHKGENARKLAYNYDWDRLAQTFHNQVESLLQVR